MDPITFILLDNTKTTYGISVLVDGVDIDQFKVNPVMFYQHNDWNMPVGKWDNVRKLNGQLLADAIFDEDDTDKDVKRMIKKVQKGFIKMASCGLVDLETSIDPADPENGYVVTKCRLREASIVPLGGNYNALRLYDKNDKEIDLQNDNLKLSDFIKKQPNIEIMDKELLALLNLSESATPAEQKAKVELLLSDKKAADEALAAEKIKTATIESEKTTLKTKLDVIELADKTAKKTAFDLELSEAFKDGRLDEKPEGDKATPVKDSFINLFDKDPEMAMTVVKSLAKHSPGSMNLTDTAPAGETAFQKRQREIEEAAAAKKAKK